MATNRRLRVELLEAIAIDAELSMTHTSFTRDTIRIEYKH